MMLRVDKKIFRKPAKGVGLYSAEQTRNTTAFQRYALAAVGLVLVGVALLSSWAAFELRRAEYESFGSAEPHVGMWFLAIALLAWGVLVGHTGWIFIVRKLVGKPDAGK